MVIVALSGATGADGGPATRPEAKAAPQARVTTIATPPSVRLDLPVLLSAVGAHLVDGVLVDRVVVLTGEAP